MDFSFGKKAKKASKINLETLDRDGESVLHYAAVNNDIETCKLLLVCDMFLSFIP